MRQPVRSLLAIVAALALVVGLAPPALAVTRTWDAGSCSAAFPNWNIAGCWQGGVAPVAGDDVVVSAQAGSNANLGVNLLSVTVPDGLGQQIIQGSVALQSGGSFNHANSNGGETDSMPAVVLNGPATFNKSGGDNLMQFDGAVSGTGPLTLTNNSGDDRLRLTQGSSYTGATTVSGTNRVRFDVNDAVDTASALTVSGSALFQTASTVGSLAGAGNVFMNGSNALTVGGNNTSTTYSGVYQNSGGTAALTKTGTGTLTLSGANTHTGATTVSAGALSVTGSTASPVTVSSGGTLGGTGTLSSTAAANSGGTLAPGTSVGTLSTGALTLASGSTYAVEMDGSGSDRVNVTGAVSLSSATLDLSLLSGYAHTPGTVYTIVSNDAADAVTGTFSGLSEGATITSGGNRFTISYVGSDGNDVTLTAAAAPSSPSFTLTVTNSGSGSGTVTGTGIDCGTDCSQGYNSGNVVTLTANPAPDSTFDSWSGCDSVAGNQCTVTMNAGRTVTATFLAQRDLTVAKAGNGLGTITSSAAGIDCGTDCTEAYADGTTLTLTATPASGSTFGSWSGCDAVSGTECTVAMSADRNVTARFDAIHARSVSLNLRRHLVARGRVSVADGFDACAAGVPMKIQRRTEEGWVTLKKVTTGEAGRFRAELRDRGGRYRATATRIKSGFDICAKALSPVARHRLR